MVDVCPVWAEQAAAAEGPSRDGQDGVQEGPREGKTMTTDRKYPRKREPASPMKIEAGLKLKTRKPPTAPSMAAVYSASSGLPLASARTNVVPSAMVATPAASPSSPSIKFIAFITPATQSMVNGTANGPSGRWRSPGSWSSSTVNPPQQRKAPIPS